MDRFESQFEDMDVATAYYENATSSATAVATPQEDVDRLMSQVADEAGVELSQEMNAAQPAKSVKVGPTDVEEDGYVSFSDSFHLSAPFFSFKPP
jgi:charged multivesicular body protein 1